MKFPNCPNCKTDKLVDYSGDEKLSESGEFYYVKVYKCHKCGCEFNNEDIWKVQNTAMGCERLSEIIDMLSRILQAKDVRFPNNPYDKITYKNNWVGWETCSLAFMKVIKESGV